MPTSRPHSTSKRVGERVRTRWKPILRTSDLLDESLDPETQTENQTQLPALLWREIDGLVRAGQIREGSRRWRDVLTDD